jgi:hypothetical protein
VFSVRPCILTNQGFREQLFEWFDNQYWNKSFLPHSISLIEVISDNESDKSKSDKPKKMEIVYAKPETL